MGTNDLPCSASVAELQRDTGHLHDAADLEMARIHLRERFHEGKTVKRINLSELLHAELEGMHKRAELSTQEVVELLLANGEREAKADQFVNGVIERFLETNEDFVAEIAAELALEGC